VPPQTQDILSRREEIEAPPDPDRYTALRRLATSPEHRFVVSLGGGSVPGISGNLALIRLLEQLDLKSHVDEIWGTSAGAVVGGGWATGTDAETILDLLSELGRGRTLDVCWWRLAAAALMRPFGGSLPQGLIHGRRFVAAIERGMACELIEDCPISFRSIACSDDGRLRRKIFRRGPVKSAILASMSMPGILVPRPIDEDGGKTYYDGGLVEKTPLISPIAEHNRAGDDRKLVLLATHYGAEGERLIGRNFVSRFIQGLYALEDLAWGYQLVEARSHDNVVLLLLNPHIEGIGLFDFDKVHLSYLHARAAFKDLLENSRIALTFGLD